MVRRGRAAGSLPMPGLSCGWVAEIEWQPIRRPPRLRSVPIVTRAQLRAFAGRGYLVLPGLVTPADLDRAAAEADRLIAAAPPADGHVGHHFYWPGPAEAPMLFDFLARRGGILDAAADLTGHTGIEVAFGQAQVALNIPPYPHRPGRPHIDGYRAGQAVPGTFTLLAGLLLNDQTTSDGGNLWVWPGTHHHWRQRERADPAGPLLAAVVPGHAGRWAECLADPWHEYASIRPVSQA